MPTLLPRPSRRPALRLRRPLPFWVLATALGLATTLLVGRLVAGAEAERARWGEVRPTLVATADVEGGHRLAGHVAVRRLPAVLVPPGALRDLPADAVAAVDVHEGEPVLAARLVGPGSSAVAARLPAGTRGVAVPTGSGLPLEVGDRVDVLATFDAGTTGEGEPTFAVARRAVVVHVGEDAVTVAVSTSAAPRVAYALAAGAVTLVLSGPK
ncbi:MAG: Flp pilus assembly protein RcpC/CpaB [Actinomycetia bacterium]|nr:Flp pilus assembly protein RcpC/CpaB [Actinomycetes bacterium]